MSDIAIAQACSMLPITKIGEKLGIEAHLLELYGNYKAKLPLNLIDLPKAAQASLILVSAITPTPAGEGKTTVSIGLHEGLCALGKKSVVVLREPSLGPVFGVKGGAAGGGYSQVVPMEDINLHFTGDFSAIEKANNLLAAVIDNVLQTPNHPIALDPKTVLWKRVMDMNDRALREIITGMGPKSNGVMRAAGFNITAASEIMAILCFATSIADLKHRIGKILVGFTYANEPVFARDLLVQEAMTILLKDAIKPNLVQTLEGNPAIIHGGPFANIAQGTNTLLATQMGLSLADFVVTEAGFGADLGAEKFLNLKCVYGNLQPKALVLVATIRALKHHGGLEASKLSSESIKHLTDGFANLAKHIENARKFGLNPLVAINHFVADTDTELQTLQALCAGMGVEAVVSKGWAHGSNGTQALAKALLNQLAKNENHFKPLYSWQKTPKEKIAIIAREIYGADSVSYTAKALQDLKSIEHAKLSHLPICMAKTQKSFSDNEKLYGRPSNFKITIREVEVAAGAGFLIPIAGNMMRMPGLPKNPASEQMHIDDDGKISGLS